MNLTQEEVLSQTAKCSTEHMRNIKKLSVLIPVYNSETTIERLVDSIIEILAPEFEALEIMLVNDGSMDDSHSCAKRIVKNYPHTVKYVRLARNFGEHNAVMCGLNYVTGDCVAIIDDDFQNPPSEILNLVDELQKGYDVIYSYYSKKRHSWFRNFGSAINDWFATRLLKKPKGLYLSSFKLISARLVDIIVQYKGPYPYIDGIILRSTSKIGCRQCKHAERKEGRSNYTIRKLLSLWSNMFTGYSVMPLRLASIIGLFISLFSVFLICFFIVSRMTGGIFLKQSIPPGWASLIIAVTFFGGIQLCVLGLIGEYLGRLSLTINRQPQFIISSIYGIETKKQELSSE